MLVIEKILSNPSISGKEIQKTFFISPATMYSWIQWYNEGGLELLKIGNGGRGVKSKDKKIYDDKPFEELKKEIDNNQDKVWTLEKMQYFLKDKFDIEPTIQAIRYRIKDTHSYKSSRPYPHKGDRDKMGRFKKTE
jgi:transposase